MCSIAIWSIQDGARIPHTRKCERVYKNRLNVKFSCRKYFSMGMHFEVCWCKQNWRNERIGKQSHATFPADTSLNL